MIYIYICRLLMFNIELYNDKSNNKITGWLNDRTTDRPTNQTDRPTKQTTDQPTDQPTKPTNQPTKTTDPRINQPNRPTKPPDQPTKPTDEPNRPTNQPTKPTDQLTLRRSRGQKHSSHVMQLRRPYQQPSHLLRDFNLPPQDSWFCHSSGFYAALVRSCLPTFRHSRSFPAWPFKMGLITCSETSGETSNLRCVRTQKSEDISPPLIRSPSHMNPVRVLNPLRKFHLILSSRLRLGRPSSLFSFTFSKQNLLWTSPIPQTCHMICPTLSHNICQ